jgi:hypothetical protein
MIVAGSASPLLLASSAKPYLLERSLRLRKSASAYLSRIFTNSPTSRTTMTMSFWVKRGTLGDANSMFLYGTFNNWETAFFNSSDQLTVNGPSMAGQQGSITTTQVFRDSSAWYHIVVVYDTTNATASDRIVLYVNGSRVTTFSSSTNSNQNNTTTEWLVSGGGSWIGNSANAARHLDCYMAEINVVDGQALTPTSFGSTSSTTGVWQPKKYTGTYGTNGFYLPFTDNSALTTSSNVGLGKDFSGNSNFFVTNNISITAGSTYDSMTDVPTLTDETTANFCVMNPLDKRSIAVVSNGNLNTSCDTSGSWGQVRGTLAFPTSGKFYWEVTLSTVNTEDMSVGIGNETTSLSLNFAPSSWANVYVILDNGDLYVNNSSTTGYGTAFSNGNVFMVAFDRDNSKIYFGRNGTWFNSSDPATQTNPAASGISTSLTFFPMTGSAGFTPPTGQHNFGQRPFAYTPPTGFVALNTFNLPTPTIGATASTLADDYFNIALYTGNATARTISGLGFQPDFNWTKPRNATGSHVLTDSVRGVTNFLETNSTGAEQTGSTGIQSWNSDGYALGTGNDWNASGETFVSWNWRASGSTVSNTAGSITSTVSANTSAGFSVVTYTAPSSGAFTVGHGLGVAPAFIITKSRSNSGYLWGCYHQSIGNTGRIDLNSTAATTTSLNGAWNNTSPTSTVFSVGLDWAGSGITYVAYCFSEVAGYSKFGSYTGNGSADGPFIYTGFKPAMIWTKPSSDAGAWNVLDNKRGPYNVNQPYLQQNSSNAEATVDYVDFLSNGFKIRYNGATPNGSGQTIIYIAFAENPFKYSLAR